LKKTNEFCVACEFIVCILFTKTSIFYRSCRGYTHSLLWSVNIGVLFFSSEELAYCRGVAYVKLAQATCLVDFPEILICCTFHFVQFLLRTAGALPWYHIPHDKPHELIRCLGGGRGRRKKIIQKSPVPASPSKSSMPESPSNDLGEPLTDEEDETPTPTEPESYPPIPKLVLTRFSDMEMVIKPEPVTFSAESSTSQTDDVPLPSQFVEHSYSYADPDDVLSDVGQQRSSLALEEELPLSRTSGRKCAGDEDCFGEDVDGHGVDIVVRMRRKRAPLITNRLIIPIVMVARTAETEKSVKECAGSEMNVAHNAAHNALDRHVASTGELLC